MALQVWLPLLGATTAYSNQGVSGLTFDLVPNTSSSGIAYNTAGKIGHCVGNNHHQYGGLISNTTINLGQNQSMFCWFKATSFQSDSSLGGGLVSQHRYSSNAGMGITLKYVSSTTAYLSVNTGNGSSRTYNTYCGTTLLSTGTWYHGGYTYDGSTLKIYVNGVCEYTGSISGMSVPADYLTVFCWSMSGTSGSDVHPNYKFDGYINDVRVYDHCLSPKEVKELSKGLIAHFPLADPYVEFTTNLVTGLTAGGRTTVGDNGLSVTSTGENADTYFTINLSEDIVVGTQYTISCNVSGMPVTGSWEFPLGLQGNTALSWYLHNGYNVKTFTANDISWGTKRIFMDDLNGRATCVGYQVKFYNFQVEKKDHATGYVNGSRSGSSATTVYDTSGYKNNGTSQVNYGLAVDTNSIRHKYCTYFGTGLNNYIRAPITISTALNTITMTAWIRSKNGTAGGGSYHMPLNINDQQYEFSIDSSGYFRNGFVCNGSRVVNTTSGPNIISDKKWHMIAATYDGTTIRRYVDGVQVQTQSASGNLSGGSKVIYVGTYGTGTSYYTKELYESDLRVYATCLSADDIKELYEASASTDNKGNTYVHELIEE